MLKISSSAPKPYTHAKVRFTRKNSAHGSRKRIYPFSLGKEGVNPHTLGGGDFNAAGGLQWGGGSLKLFNLTAQ